MHNMIILYPKVSCLSARALANELGVKSENPYKTRHNNFSAFDVVFKYGFSSQVLTNQKAVVLNNSPSIRAVLDKVKTFQLMDEIGVQTVPYTLAQGKAIEWIREGNSCWARSTSTGARSEGMIHCINEKEVKESPAIFWTKMVESTHEFRVNCWKDKVVSVYYKAEIEEKGELVFEFRLFDKAMKNPQLKQIVEKIYKKTGLDWYGVDFLRTEEGNLVLLEINSGPVLYDDTLERLVKIINKEVLNGCKTF